MQIRKKPIQSGSDPYNIIQRNLAIKLLGFSAFYVESQEISGICCSLSFFNIAFDFLRHLKAVYRAKSRLNERTALIHFRSELLKYCIGTDKQILLEPDLDVVQCTETMNFYDISENCMYSKVCQLCRVVPKLCRMTNCICFSLYE